MRRKEREITEFAEIVEVLQRADTIRVGLFNGEYPYIVPVSFGMELCANSKVLLYFHGAKKGLKNECAAANNKVCVEADIFHMIQPTKIGITTRYESVIGFGTIEEASSDEEKIYGLQKIVEHYGYSDYPTNKCKGLPMTTVFKITLDQITGKRNLPEEAV